MSNAMPSEAAPSAPASTSALALEALRGEAPLPRNPDLELYLLLETACLLKSCRSQGPSLLVASKDLLGGLEALDQRLGLAKTILQFRNTSLKLWYQWRSPHPGSCQHRLCGYGQRLLLAPGCGARNQRRLWLQERLHGSWRSWGGGRTWPVPDWTGEEARLPPLAPRAAA